MYNHTVKFLPQHCTLEYFTEEHIQALTWTVALFLHYSECGFWHVPPQSRSVKFLFVVYEKTSCFPWLVECDELQQRHLSFRKSTTGKIIQPLAYWLKCTHWSHTMKLKHVLLTSSMCSSCWDYILLLMTCITLFQTTFLREHEWRIIYKQHLSHGKLVSMMQQIDRSVVFYWMTNVCATSW